MPSGVGGIAYKEHLSVGTVPPSSRTKGKKRAIVAAGHTILVIVYHMLTNQQPYRDLGSDYFDRRNSEQLKRSLIRRLEGLGSQVSIESSHRPEEG